MLAYNTHDNGLRVSTAISRILLAVLVSFFIVKVDAFASPPTHHSSLSCGTSSTKHVLSSASSSSILAKESTIDNDNKDTSSPEAIFEQFAQFLIQHQTSMIAEIEQADGSDVAFSKDGWGAFENGTSDDNTKSGGITRVIQGGNVVEKGGEYNM